MRLQLPQASFISLSCDMEISYYKITFFANTLRFNSLLATFSNFLALPVVKYNVSPLFEFKIL